MVQYKILVSEGFILFDPLKGVLETAGSSGNRSAKSELKDLE